MVRWVGLFGKSVWEKCKKWDGALWGTWRLEVIVGEVGRFTGGRG